MAVMAEMGSKSDAVCQVSTVIFGGGVGCSDMGKLSRFDNSLGL